MCRDPLGRSFLGISTIHPSNGSHISSYTLILVLKDMKAQKMPVSVFVKTGTIMKKVEKRNMNMGDIRRREWSEWGGVSAAAVNQLGAGKGQ